MPAPEHAVVGRKGVRCAGAIDVGDPVVSALLGRGGIISRIMSRISAVISYSHDSPEHSARVLAFAQALRANGIDVELDQFHGEEIVDWPRWCNEQTSREANDFVLCVCTAEYRRRIDGRVAPEAGKGAYWEGSLLDDEVYDAKGNGRIIPILFDDEPESAIPRFLSGWTRCRLKEFALGDAGFEQLLRILTGQGKVVKEPLGPIPILPSQTARASTRPRIAEQRDERTQREERRVAPTRLTHVADRLFGREAELTRLDAAWKPGSGIRVITIVAWGGTGKTSLVAKWAAALAARDYDGADYFDWSFYSQGTRDQSGASADQCIQAALEFFGDRAMAQSPASAWDKGARLAQLVAKRRTLLILDGLEPLQHPPGPQAGELKDPAVTALLRGLADLRIQREKRDRPHPGRRRRFAVSIPSRLPSLVASWSRTRVDQVGVQMDRFARLE